ncbi:MAG: BON domain-containing protein [Pirellulales bacterium]|nr:BON domain-containing protein [Pirellulales bacterium]
MRRKYFGLAIAAFATLGPMQAFGGDREIAEQIIKRLKSNRDSGALKDFTLDMKVDQGVVLFRGNVSQDSQKELVLAAAAGIDGIAQVVDEVSVRSDAKTGDAEPKKVAEQAAPVAPTAVAEAVAQPQPPKLVQPPTATKKKSFSFKEALAAQAKVVTAKKPQPLQVVPGQIQRTAAVESNNDQRVVSAVVEALSEAKNKGQLRGFGVDVQSQNGVLQLTGRASSAEQRDTIVRIAEKVPGVSGVREAISIPAAAVNLPPLPEPPALRDVREVGQATLTPVAVDHVNQPARRGTHATAASAPIGVPAAITPYPLRGGQPMAYPAGMAHPVAGQPVPMAPYGGGGAGPRYDTPTLPNYAWPGYAAYPNYAALTYPQQYSPSAWPYIGPFYPYPQVPLGWRRVSLEWDDGWWFLDFTDR